MNLHGWLLSSSALLPFAGLLRAIARVTASGSGTAGQPSDAMPVMDGVGAPGTSLLYSRGDHQHPTDTSKLNLTGGTLTGSLAVMPAAPSNQPAQLGVGGQGVSYLALGTIGQNISLAVNGGVPYFFQNGIALSGLATQQYVQGNFLPLSGGVLNGDLRMSAGTQLSLQATGSSIYRSENDRAADRFSVLDWLTAGQPDGTTDNTAQLQQAITAAGGKGSLTFPANANPYIIGTSGSTGGLQIPTNSHLIVEAGATLKVASGSSANVFGIVAGATNVLIDLYGVLDGNSTGTGGIVTLPVVPGTGGTCSNVYVRGNRQGLIKNFVAWGINITACVNGEVNGITVDTCGSSTEFAGITPWIGTANTPNITSGVYTPSSRALVVTTTIAHGLNPGDAFTILGGGLLSGTGNYPALAGSYVAEAGTGGPTINTHTVHNITAASITSGIVKGPTKPCVNVGFSDCIIRNINDLGCVLYGGVYNGFIRGCDVNNCTSGGAMIFSDNAQCGENRSCEIVDCVLWNNHNTGAYVGGNAFGVVQKDTTIARNSIYGNNQCGIFANYASRLLIEGNDIHDNVYQPNRVPSLGITGEISLTNNSERISVLNNTIHNPNVGCADFKGFGIAFDTSNYLIISGNRIGDYSAGDNVTALYMYAALGGQWGQYGLTSDNYYGPRVASVGDVNWPTWPNGTPDNNFPADASVYVSASQKADNYDAVLRLHSGAPFDGAIYGRYNGAWAQVVPLTGGTLTGPLNLTATGTTTSRSEQDRWGAVFNVKDFGAVGDGVTNDTAAFQAAVAAVPASGGVVYASRGIYLVSSPLLLKANTWLRGDGTQTTTIKMAAGTNLSPMIGNAASPSSNICLSDFTIDGNKAANAGFGYGVLFLQVSVVTARSIEVQNVSGTGFVISGNGDPTTRGAHVSRLHVHDCANSGFVVTYACRQVVIDGLRAYNNGAVANPTYPAVLLDASECVADNVLADSNINNGIHIHNVFGCTYNNLTATRNGAHGIYVETLVRSIGANWRAQSNGTLTSNTYDDIHFANTNVVVPGYGITANCEVSGIAVGPDANFGSSQERYGLYIEDNVNSNIRLNDISYVGACLTGNMRPPANIGTLKIDDVLLKPNVSGMFTGTGASTVSGAGTLTLFPGAGVGSHTVPANSAKVGSRYRAKVVGYYTTPAAASNLTLAVALGGVTLASTTVAATTSISSGYFEAEAEVTVRAIGSGGTVVAAGRAMLFTAVGAVQTATWVTNTGPVAVNLAVDAVLDLTGSWSAPTSHSITGQQSWAEAIAPGG